MRIPHTVGVGIAGDAFYGPRDPKSRQLLIDAGVVSVEMESDTLFILGMFRRWRTGALFASDGTPTEVKPEWGMQAFRQGEENAIKIALDAIARIAAEE
jgi:uridine phosphorylase